MDKAQKIILISLISISAIAWLFSIEQPDMMEAMMTLNPIALSIFTASWTIGMAAMMFPAIIPMVLLYNRLINGDKNKNINHNTELQDVNSKRKHQFVFAIYPLKSILFVISYLLVWSLTGLLFLVAWSILTNNLLIGYNQRDLDIVYGILLVVSGLYQFSTIKSKCLGYCETPLAFFTKRWKGNNVSGALKMGLYHALYCLGCCWPYFLLMVALGWMNVLWMILFAGIIFAEKIWTKGIWIAKIAGIAFIITGGLMIIGIFDINSDMRLKDSTMDNMAMVPDIDSKEFNGNMEMSTTNYLNSVNLKK